jgi:hypothetical protein
MKKLWLDDERPTPPGWVGVTTAPKAIRELRKQIYEEVSLDHDLGPPEAGTGYDVLLFLEEMAHDHPGFFIPTVRIHTANPVAWIHMHLALRSLEKMRR